MYTCTYIYCVVVWVLLYKRVFCLVYPGLPSKYRILIQVNYFGCFSTELYIHIYRSIDHVFFLGITRRDVYYLGSFSFNLFLNIYI